jgi:hypothetical protein
LFLIAFQFVKHVSCVTLRPTNTAPSVMCRSIKQDHFRTYGQTRHYRTLCTSWCLAYFKVSNKRTSCCVEYCNVCMHRGMAVVGWCIFHILHSSSQGTALAYSSKLWYPRAALKLFGCADGRGRCFLCQLRLCRLGLGADLTHREFIHIAISFHYFPNESMNIWMLGHSIVSQHFIESEGSIPNSQELSTCSYP